MSHLVLVTREPQQAMLWRAELTIGRQHEVVAITNSARAARDLLAKHRPRVVVCDLRLLDGTALAMIQSLSAEPDAQRPLILVVAPDETDPLLLEALRSGADNYHVTGHHTDTLMQCLHKTLLGEAMMTPSIARALLDFFDRHERPNTDWRPIDEMQSPLRLAPHERDLLLRLSTTHTIEQLAEHRNIALRELGLMARDIYRKMLWDMRAGDLSLQLA